MKDEILRAKQGELEAFEKIVTAFEKKIYNLCFRMTGNAQDGEDITQEVFIKIYKKIEDFKEESALSTWIYRIATNTCYDFLRKTHGYTVSIDDDNEYIFNQMPLSKEGDPQVELEKQMVKETIEESILSLKPDYKSIVILRDIMGLSYAQIGDILKLKEGTIKSRLARSRKQLRKKILEKRNVIRETTSNI